ncbi:hypothetical protein XENTR_v10018546 [Xenopus tropicalis]|nr:hypothetical protein XENTR_v10018546 [Xenopus tropicalis]
MVSKTREMKSDAFGTSELQNMSQKTTFTQVARIHIVYILLLVLLNILPVALLPLSLKEGKVSVNDAKVPKVVSEAIQKLQEVFAFGEVPLNILPEKKPPQFMLELYSRVASPDGSTKAPGLLQGNIVRSFENKAYSESGEPLFFFNISSMGSREKMLKAELRVFKWKPLRIVPRHHFCKVDVYELIDSATRPWRGNLISSRLLPLQYQGWEMFNVTQTVSNISYTAEENEQGTDTI